MRIWRPRRRWWRWTSFRCLHLLTIMFLWLDRLCQQILWSIVRLLVNHAEKCGVIRNWTKICQPIMIFLEGRKKMLRQNKPSSSVLLLVAAAAVVSVGYIMTLGILARAISRSYYSCHWIGMLWMCWNFRYCNEFLQQYKKIPKRSC